ncbi:aminodeoxychorismate synthase component I [Pseudonocardia sp. N23]|uniref:aminodeoxychorismate synthase component I n=1 Tax=Pseudonocardia sp. N23 TaxID=1987376 RepID=UPI000BFCFD2B|nr:aminodeoxychorismate synthase component I [Pseudonocardia sp. N23]GAY09491.1 para-aminobenzoate synthase, aminase component [Pseudonocardia sp. N23]
MGDPVLRLHTRPLPAALDGLTVFDAVRRLAHRTRVTAWSGSWSRGALVTCDPAGPEPAPDADPFALMGDVPAVDADPDARARGAVGGGWFGYLAFRAGAAPASEVPAWSLAWYRDVLRHDGRRWWYEALLDGSDDLAATDVRCAGLVGDLSRPAAPQRARLEVVGVPGRDAHVAAVEHCVQAIRRGEIYQANIATRLDLRLHGSPAEAWARLGETLGPARAGFVADPRCTAVGAGPEVFLHRDGTTVRTEPIKGTRPRTGSSADERERAALAASAKDAAENVMIVDLMRNDLSRVCATGTVTVPRLLAVEPHPGVWHLVSEVRGEIAAGTGDAALLAAAFPPGSVTGAPKIRAVEIIEDREPVTRGLFTGAMGFAGPLAGLELAVTIRTLEVLPDGRTHLGVGGGVTVDSSPAEEWRECLTKAAPLLRVLGATLPASAGADPGPPGGGVADPALGVFETLLVVDGEPRRLADHLRRLHRSFWELYGIPLRADVAAAVRAAVGTGTGADGGTVAHLRVRVDARPDRPGEVRAVATPCDAPVPPADQPGVLLTPVRGVEGLPHKFADRAWLDALEASVPDGTVPLLVTTDGHVLETTRSCVAVVRDGRVATPPLDGRLLPGTARQAVLDALDTMRVPYDPVPVRLDELAGADAMLLCNAVRGVQWVRTVSGAADWDGPAPLVTALADAITAGPAHRGGGPAAATAQVAFSRTGAERPGHGRGTA